MRDFNIKKLYYSISEVSKITTIEQYVLRYWETEFGSLKPQKNRAGNRAYTNQDIKLILIIHYLLRVKKYTLEGAKQIMAEKGIEELEREMNAVQKPVPKPAPPLKETAPPEIEAVIPKKNEAPPEQVVLDRKTAAALKSVLKEILNIL